jgi:hypothetical protein
VAARRTPGISDQGRVRGLLARDIRVFAAFARRDWLSVLIVTFLAALPQGRLAWMARSAIVEGVRSPGGAFLTVIQAALIGCVVGEVLWEGERPSTWAFYRSAGALPTVVLSRTVFAIVGAALWYAIVTAPTSLLIGTASFEKHAFALAAVCGLAGVSALGSALGAVLGSSAAQSRALRMGGMVGVAGLFFRLSSASSLVHVGAGIVLLACVLGASLALLRRADLGLQRL